MLRLVVVSFSFSFSKCNKNVIEMKMHKNENIPASVHQLCNGSDTENKTIIIQLQRNCLENAERK